MNGGTLLRPDGVNRALARRLMIVSCIETLFSGA
jgi:hypothetical protein